MPYENLADLIQQNMDAADALNRETAEVQRGLDSVNGFAANLATELASCVESSERFFTNLQQECDTLDGHLKSHLDLVNAQGEHMQQQIAALGEILDALEAEVTQPLDALSAALDDATHFVADFSSHATTELDALQKGIADTADSQDHEVATLATELTNVAQLAQDFTSANIQDTQTLVQQCDALHNTLVQEMTNLGQELQGLGPAIDSHVKQLQEDLQQQLTTHLNDLMNSSLFDTDHVGQAGQRYLDALLLLKTDLDQLTPVFNEMQSYCDTVDQIITALQQLWPNYNSLMHVGDGGNP